MDRKILFVLAAVAGVGAALLLLPARDEADVEMAVGRERKVEATQPRTHTTRAASDEAVQEPATPRVHRHATAESKEEAAEAFEARRASPYYKHVQVVVKYWTHLGNLFSAAGSSTVAQTAKDMGSALRKANLPDAQDEQREVALQQEAELLAQLKPRYPDGEVGAILDYLEAASEAAKNGEIPPPKPDIEFSIDYGADATDANK